MKYKKVISIFIALFVVISTFFANYIQANSPKVEEQKAAYIKTFNITSEEADQLFVWEKLERSGDHAGAEKILTSLSSTTQKKVRDFLDSAHSKGADSGIKSAMSILKSDAKLFFEKKHTYKGVCNDTITTKNINMAPPVSYSGFKQSMLRAVKYLNKSSPIVSKGNFIYNKNKSIVYCHDSKDGWATIISLKLPNIPRSGYCIDSSGNEKEAIKLSRNSIVCGK